MNADPNTVKRGNCLGRSEWLLAEGEITGSSCVRVGVCETWAGSSTFSCFCIDFENITHLQLQLERRLRVLNFGGGSIIHEPKQLSVVDRLYPRRRERVLRRVIHDLGQNILLGFSCSHERDPARVVNNRVRQRYPLGWRLRRVFQVSNPPTLLGQQLVGWKQRSRVPVRPEAEQDKVEDGEPCRVPLPELADQLLLVRIGEAFKVFEEGGVDDVNVFGRYVDFGEEDVHAEFVVGVFVVEGHDSFIGVENFPVNLFQRPTGISKLAPYPHQFSHLIPVFPINPPSSFGSDPPDNAIVKRPFLSIAEFCVLRMNPASASTSSALDAKEWNFGGDEV